MPSTPDIDVSALAEALNEKLDRDGYNATDDIKEMMAHMSVPSTQYIALTVPPHNGVIVSPSDGWLTLGGITDRNEVCFVRMTGLTDSSSMVNYPNYGITVTIPVGKYEQVQIMYYGVTQVALTFHYAKGLVSNNQ